MDSALTLLNTKYKNWTFLGIEKITGMFSGIIHETHSGYYLLFKLQKDDIFESFLLTQGSRDDKDNFIQIIPHEHKLNYIFCDDEDEEEKDLINEACTKYMYDSSVEEEEEEDDEEEFETQSLSSSSQSSYADT